MTSSIIGIDTKTGQRVNIFKLSRLLGLYIIGIPGTGKTGLIENLIIQDIIQGVGVGLLDPHGDLTHAVLSRLPDRRVNDVIYLDITDYTYPFGLNLFECSDLTDPVEVQKTVDQVMHIFDRLFEVTRTTPLIIQYLRNCTHTLVANPGYTIADIPLLLRNKGCRSKLVAKLRDRNVLGFWQDYDDMKPSDQRAEREPILRRLEELLQPLTFNIVGQSTTTIDIRQVMDEGKILLVKLSAQLPYVTSLIGSVLIALFLNAAYSRTDLPMNKRKQFNLYADEFQRFATEDFATLLTEARKFGIATTIAHQARFQPGMTDGIRATSLSAANLVVFKVNSNDAEELAGEFNITPPPEQLQEIEKEELIGLKPVRTYKGDVIGHLLHQGHEDEREMAFVKGCLEKLHLASLKKIQHTQYIDIYPVNHLGIEYDPERIPEVLADLNTWLVAGMRDREALWQPLPLGTYWYLMRFFGITGQSDHYWLDYWLGHHVWYAPVYRVAREAQEHAEQRWQEFHTNGFAEEAQYSGINRERLVNAAIASVEAGFADFLSSLFPILTRASIREVWRQSGLSIPSCTLSQMREHAALAHDRIIAALLEETNRQPGLDAALYTQRFLEELSRPRNAVELFLPVLYNSYSKATSIWEFDGEYLQHDYHAWRTVREVAATKVPPYFESDKRRIDKEINEEMHLYKERYLYNLKLTPRFTYHLETLSDNIRLGIIQGMQSYLAPFLASLRFFAGLHCAQLALFQGPIETMDSGQYEQDKRTQTHYIMHSQRAYADMLNEVASRLTNLPLYTAQVKITTEEGRAEHTIRTLDPKAQSDRPLFGQALQARLARIKEQNIQDGYLRERAGVEEEIRQRQEQCSQPPEEEPPISRRPPR